MDWSSYTIYSELPAELKGEVFTLNQWIKKGCIPVSYHVGRLLYKNKQNV